MSVTSIELVCTAQHYRGGSIGQVRLGRRPRSIRQLPHLRQWHGGIAGEPGKIVVKR
jgi:hypothetical protein